ncbi:MAG TPA: hypothetical protein VNT02_11680, partial [Burkholderiales bacterium]|nr:hypothetical protein [Burkholderiales bacterium]
AVFPLGMYTSATYRIGEALSLPIMLSLSRYFVAAALTAWLMTFLGFIVSLVMRPRAYAPTSTRYRSSP